MSLALLNVAKFVSQSARRFTLAVVRHKSYRVEDILSSKEIGIYKKLFNKMDSNGDGQLTREDFKKGLMEYVNYVASEQELDETMMTLDTNKSGTVDFEEFVGYIAWSRQMRVEESIKYAFETFDKNKDGLISKDELREALVSLGVVPNEPLLNNIMLVSDEDNDGNITITQFKQIFHHKNPLQ